MEKETKEMKQKKSNKLFDVFLVVLIAAVIVGVYVYSQYILVKPSVKINETELKVNMTVQELVDLGFAVDDSIAGNGDMDLDAQPDIPGESYTSTFYYVYAKDSNGYYKYTNIVFHVFNKDVNSTEFRNSQIYGYRYDPHYDTGEFSVLINDIAFAGKSKEESLAAFEELGIKFDSADKDEFMKGERNIIFGKSGDFSYIIEADYSTDVVTNIEVKRNV